MGIHVGVVMILVLLGTGSGSTTCSIPCIGTMGKYVV